VAIYSIYTFTNMTNQKVYVGISNNPERRMKTHISMSNNSSNYLLHKAIRKYGVDKFTFNVIAQTWTKELAFSLEQYFIDDLASYFHDSRFGGYNMTKGGDGVDSETARKNIQKRNKSAVAAGTHNFQGDTGSQMQKDRFAAGTHNWSGDNGKLLSKQRFDDGTHNQLLVHVCPHCQKRGKGAVMFRHHFERCKHR
jgi:group I intron endonuclease